MKLRLWLVGLVGWIGFSATVLVAQGKPAYYAADDEILILGAVPQEITPFVAAMKDGVKKELWGIPYWQGHIEGKPVVVAITGIDERDGCAGEPTTADRRCDRCGCAARTRLRQLDAERYGVSAIERASKW